MLKRVEKSRPKCKSEPAKCHCSCQSCKRLKIVLIATRCQSTRSICEWIERFREGWPTNSLSDKKSVCLRARFVKSTAPARRALIRPFRPSMSKKWSAFYRIITRCFRPCEKTLRKGYLSLSSSADWRTIRSGWQLRQSLVLQARSNNWGPLFLVWTRRKESWPVTIVEEYRTQLRTKICRVSGRMNGLSCLSLLCLIMATNRHSQPGNWAPEAETTITMKLNLIR